MPETSNETQGPDMIAAQTPERRKKNGARTVLLIAGALVALVSTYFLTFLSMLMIGFSFDAPGSHFSDSGLWARLIIIWPPVSLLLVAIAAIICIFTASLRLLWIALGIFAATILAIVIALSVLG